MVALLLLIVVGIGKHLNMLQSAASHLFPTEAHSLKWLHVQG